MIVSIHNLPSDIAGLTWKEKNMLIEHKIPIGSLVELEEGVRLFIVKHTRDCDGTPLYVLAPYMGAVEENVRNQYINKMVYGYPESSLRTLHCRQRRR